jgi:transposase-like protein
MGRKSRFRDEEKLYILKELLVDGTLAKEIAAKYEIRSETLHDWKKKYF